MSCCRPDSSTRAWLVRFTVLLLLLVSYLLFGALIFSAIERPEEQRIRKQLLDMRQQIQENDCANVSQISAFLELAARAYRRGTPIDHMDADRPSEWQFSESLFFAATIITTVGYGHVAPSTDGGRAFCVMFALVGIPLFLMFLETTVSRVLILLRLLHAKLAASLTPREISPSTTRLIHYVITATVIFVLALLVPAIIFDTIEERWSFGSSLYFVFISMSTIGLGDYVPGGDTHPAWLRDFYHCLLTVYLIAGLVLVMTLLALTGEVPELQPRACGCCPCRGLETDEEHKPVLSSGAAHQRYSNGTESQVTATTVDDSQNSLSRNTQQ